MPKPCQGIGARNVPVGTVVTIGYRQEARYRCFSSVMGSTDARTSDINHQQLSGSFDLSNLTMCQVFRDRFGWQLIAEFPINVAWFISSATDQAPCRCRSMTLTLAHSIRFDRSCASHQIKLLASGYTHCGFDLSPKSCFRHLI